jgi:hypothetical protein
MITGIFLISTLIFVGVISYRRPKLEQKVFKNIPLIDWMIILVLPVVAYIVLTLLVRNIMSKPRIEKLDIDELLILATGIFFLGYAFVGNSIHFVGKVLSRYIDPKKDLHIYKINEIFHGHLSHYMSFICLHMVFLMIAFLEINYPLIYRLPRAQFLLLILSGVLSGVSAKKAIFYTNDWFGGYNRPLFFLNLVLMSVVYLMFRSFEISFLYYPFNLFAFTVFTTIVSSFVISQIMKWTKLSNRKRMRLINRVLSIEHVHH